MLRHHGVVHGLSMRRSSILFVLVLVIGATIEIRRSFVLVWSTMLSKSQCHSVYAGAENKHVHMYIS